MEAKMTPATTKKGIFYGWYVVIASFLAHLSYGQQNSSTLGVFIRPMTDELGWSRTELTAAQSIARFVEGMVSPIIGPFLDKHGPRPLMLIGGVVAGAGFLLLSRINNLWQFYLVRGFAISVGFAIMGGMVTNTAISNWFIRQRGRAIGIGGMGMSLANIFLVPLAVVMIGHTGWRSVWVLFGVFTFIVVLVPSALWMRRRPEDMGLRPDGDEPFYVSGSSSDLTPDRRDGSPEGSISRLEEPLEPVWTRGEVVRTPAFWIIIGTFSISNLALQGINISIIPYFEDLEFASWLAAIALSTRNLFTLVFGPLWGLAVERLDLRNLRSATFGIQAVAALLFFVGHDVVVLFAAVIIYAVGISASQVVSEVIWADFYGRLTLGVVRGLGNPLLVAFSAAGPVLMNVIYDAVGSYRLAFLMFTILFALSAGLILLLQRPEAKRFAKASEFSARSDQG